MSKRHRKRVDSAKRSHWTRLGRSMLPIPLSDEERRRFRNRFIASALLLLAVWLTFFDSHSLVKRLAWHREHAHLVESNARLRSEIERLELEVGKGLSDEVVERIAREEYGMRRPGETVSRVKKAD